MRSHFYSANKIGDNELQRLRQAFPNRVDTASCRVITLLKLKNQSILLYNVYAPADGDKNNNDFFIKLRERIDNDLTNLKAEGSHATFIIGGDMNAKLDSKYDKKIQTKSNNKYLNTKI